MRKNKRFAKVILAGALAVTLASTAAVPYVSAASDDSYIIFLPTEDGVEYTYDSEHMSKEYSTENYTVLLYKPGETVSFQVNSEKEFKVEDALDGMQFTDASVLENGVVAFAMPNVDLCCAFFEDEEATDSEADEETGEESGEETDSETGNGSFKIKLGKGLSGACDMVDADAVEIKPGKSYKSSDMVDILRVTSEEGLEEVPDVNIYKNGEKVENTDGIVISDGLSKGVYVVDFKNSLSIDSDSYTVKISKKKADTGDEAEQETEETTGAATAVETDMDNDNNGAAAESVNAYYTPAEETESFTEAGSETAENVRQADTEVQASEIDTEKEPILEAETEPETQNEAMSELGVVGDGYMADSAVSSLAGGFADTIKETATAVNVTITNNIPDLPLIIKKTDGTVEAVNDGSYSTSDGISEIEFIGEMLYTPQIKILKDGGEMEAADSIIKEQKYLDNGNLFMKFMAEGILPGNYEIQIG